MGRVDTGIIQNNDGWASDLPGKGFQLFGHKRGRDVVAGGGPAALVIATEKALAVKAKASLGGNKYVFARKLPAVGHTLFLIDV